MTEYMLILATFFTMMHIFYAITFGKVYFQTFNLVKMKKEKELLFSILFYFHIILTISLFVLAFVLNDTSSRTLIIITR